MRYDLVGDWQKAVQKETGEPMSRLVASVQVDQMCDAFREVWEGAGHEDAVRRSPEVARHLMWRWEGDEGRELRKVMKELGVEQ